MATKSSAPSGSSSSYAAVKRFLVRVGPTVRARFERRWGGFRPLKPKEGTDETGGGAETLRANVAGERTGSVILLVRLVGSGSRSLSSAMTCASGSSTASASIASCLRRANNFLRPPSPAYGLLFLLFDGVSLSFSLSLEELIYLLAWPRRGLSSRWSRFMRTRARAFLRAWKSSGSATSTLPNPRRVGTRGVRYLSSCWSASSAALMGRRPETDLKQ